MPPKSSSKPSTPAAAPAADEEELMRQLEQKEAALGCAADKLERLALTQARLDTDCSQLGRQLTAERTQFTDVNAHLKHSLEEQTARAAGLERQLADARAALAAAQASAAAAAVAAEARHTAEVGEARAELERQRDRQAQAEAFLEERGALRARAEQLDAQLEAEKRQHHRRIMDLQQKHAGDRELWKKDTAEAVRQAREEMAALTDQRLDATTKQTLVENEEMACELQYQGRHVQGLLSRNSDLQREAAELRVALSIAQRGEEELAKKALACEHAVESLLARLEALEAQRCAGEAASAELSEQLAAARRDLAAAAQREAEQARQLEEAQRALEAKRRELQQVQASRTAAADFLLACLADVQQELLAQEGHAELMAAALPAGLLPATGSSGLGDEQPGGLAPAAVDASRCSAGGSGDEGSSPSKPPRLLLGQLTMRQREAALEQLLRRLQVDWRQEEGLLLPSTSGSLSSRSHAGDACPASPTTASPPPCAGAKPRSPGACAAAGAKASRPGSTSARAASAPSGAASCCTKSELMELVMSDVRPWGGPGVSRAGCRQLPSICEGGRGGGAADSERP